MHRLIYVFSLRPFDFKSSFVLFVYPNRLFVDGVSSKHFIIPILAFIMNSKTIFKVDQTMGVSKFRFYLLRFYYALNFVALGFQTWGEIFAHKGLWQPIPGIAYSFWAAFSLLAILGIIHPLKMLPLLLVQFTYKLIWSIIVAYPIWAANQLPASHELTNIMVKGVILDLFIIPWPYVLRTFIFNKNGNNTIATGNEG